MDLTAMRARLAAPGGRLSGVARFIGVSVLSAAVGLAVAGQRETLGLIVLAGVALALCLIYPYLGVIMLVLSAFSFEWLMGLGILPGSAQGLQVLIAGALTVTIILRTRQHPEVFRYVPGGRWMALFVVLAAVGVVLNVSSVVGAVFGLQPILLFVPLVLAPVALEWTEQQTRSLVHILVAAALVQPVVALYQFAFMRQGVSGDAVGGTLGTSASGSLTTFMLGMGTVFLGFILADRRWRARASLGLVWLFLPPALNETKVVFAAAPVVFGTVLFPRLRRNALGTLAGITLVAVAMVAMYQGYAAFYGTTLSTGTTVSQLVQAEVSGDTPGEGGMLRRIPSIYFASDTVRRSPTTFFFGYGAGSLGRTGIVGKPGRLIQEFGDLVRAMTFVSRVILEYGFLGLFAFVALCLALIRRMGRLAATDEDPFWGSVAFGAKGFALTMMVMSVYTATFTSDALNCTLWLLVGVCAARGMRRDLLPAVPAGQ